MIDSSNLAADAARTLEAEVAAYRTLLSLLRVEQQALLAADAAAVQDSLAEKARQVESLLQSAHERADALRRAGLAPNAADMTAWLADPARPPRARALWTELTRLAAEARAQNALNGRMIFTQQRHWDRALSSLWQAAGMSTTYGANGRAQLSPPPRALAAI